MASAIPLAELPDMATIIATELHPLGYLEFPDGSSIRPPTPWSQRSSRYKPGPGPSPPKPPKGPEPEDDHTNFAEQLRRVLFLEPLAWGSEKHPIDTHYWSRKDTAHESLYYHPKKDMKPKIRDIFATCKPYIPLVLPDDAHEPDCDSTCDTWNRQINPPFLNKLENVVGLIGHHTFAQRYYVNHSELLGKDPYGAKVFQCKRIKPGLPQVSLDARRQFHKHKDYHHTVPKQYAVKIVDKFEQKANKFRLFTEAFCLTRVLSHPNIVELHEILESETQIYIVTELCSSWRGALTLDDFFHVATDVTARKVFQELLDAIMHMHEMGVVHMCLTPQNVMFIDDRQGNIDRIKHACDWRTNIFHQIKIIDFGKAVYDPKMATEYPSFDPFDYFTREELAPRADPQVDILALGRILLAMLVGRVPVLNKNYPYRARQDHPEYSYRTQFGPAAIDLYERIFLAIQGDPDYPPTLKAIRNHPWVDYMYGSSLREIQPVSSSYTNCETYLHQFCVPNCKFHHLEGYACKHNYKTQ